MNKSLKISIPIFVAVVVSVIVTTTMIDNKRPNMDFNPNQEISITDSKEKGNKMDKIYVVVNNEKFKISLEENSTTSALAKLLPLNIVMDDLNENEKYVYLDVSLPTNAYSPKHIEVGDVMLFGNNCLVIFYESFDTNYSYTKIGHIDNLPNLGDGSIHVALGAE